MKSKILLVKDVVTPKSHCRAECIFASWKDHKCKVWTTSRGKIFRCVFFSSSLYLSTDYLHIVVCDSNRILLVKDVLTPKSHCRAECILVSWKDHQCKVWNTSRGKRFRCIPFRCSSLYISTECLYCGLW